MKIKKGFVIQKVDGSYLACATGKLAKEFSAVAKLNATGLYIWNMIEQSADAERDAIVAAFANEFGVSSDLAERDVDAFLATLSSNGILEE